MSARALIIGIDAYPKDPLEGAVNDAKAFADALLRLELVTGEEMVVLLSDDPATDGPADRDTIKKEITRLYREADEVDRLFFYFAGHGMLAFQDPSATQAVTALLPADLESLADEGDKLIVVEEVCGYLRRAGPGEQFYFIDACRDMPYDRNPRPGNLGLGDKTPQSQRSQSVLYAVSELNRAVEIGDKGAMSKHLVAALEGRGRALDYSYEHSPPFVVTMESVHNYVKARLEEIQAPIPVPSHNGPPPRPLRQVANPPPRHLTVHIQPAAMAEGTEVTIGLGANAPVVELPPQENHVPAEVEPRPHNLVASSVHGAVDPARCMVDTREQEEVTVRVGSESPGPPQPGVEVAAAPEVSREQELYIRGELAADAALERPTPSGWLQVSARHPLHAVNAIGLEPPYVEERAFGELSRELPAGSYRVEFRQEPDLLAAAEVFVADASEVSVRAPEEPEPPQEAPAIALQRFARDVLPEVDADAGYDVTLAIATEYRGGSLDFGESLDSVLVTARGRLGSLETDMKPQGMGWGELGFARIDLGEQPFELDLEGGATGILRFASIALPGCATLVTIHLGSGGTVDLSQILIPRAAVDDQAAVSRFQIGQGLYRAGDLLAAPIASFFAEDLRTGNLDPVLASMTLLAAAEGRPGRGDRLFLGQVRELLANHLDLPDARVALAAAGENSGDLLEPLLEQRVQPLLDRSTAFLAGYALATGREDHPLVARRQLVPPGQSWNLVRSRPDGLQLAIPTATKLLHR